MLVLLAVLLSCALAQSTAGTTITNATNDIVPLTINQNPGSFSILWDESAALFQTSAMNRGNFLWKVGYEQSNGQPVQTLLSHDPVAIGSGVISSKVSPDLSYVLFTSSVTAFGAELYSVGIGGGTIKRITPSAFPISAGASSTGAWSFPPCPVSGSRSDFFWGTFGTAYTGGGTFVNEIWTNNRDGDYKRISVALGQQQDTDAPVKLLNVLEAGTAVFSDYIFYEANPGPDNSATTLSNAPRNIYMADWSGNNWLINPTPTVAYANSSIAAVSGTFLRSSPGCGSSGPGRYVAIADIVDVAFTATQAINRAVFVYDVSAKKSLGVVSPSGVGTCTLLAFAPDESGLAFQCAASTTDTNKDVYIYDLAKGGAATKISVPWPAANLPGSNGAVTGLTIQGDFLVWGQVVTTTSLTSVVSYNWKLKTGPTQLFTETSTPGTGIRLAAPDFDFADAESSSFTDVGAGSVTKTGYVWFQVQDGTGASTLFQYYAAALAGAANSAVSVVATSQVSNLQARLCTGCGDAVTDSCKVTSLACRDSKCACSQQCSGWVTFLGLPTGSQQWQVYSAKYDGTSVTVTSLATTVCNTVPVQPVIATGIGSPGDASTVNGRRINHPFKNPLQQFLYFTATTGTVGSEVQNLYAVQAGSANVITIGNPSPVAKGGVLVGGGSSICLVTAPTNPTTLTGTNAAPLLSPDGKWIIYQSQTITNALITAPAVISKPVAETFLASADGSTTPQKVSPTLDADHTSSGIGGNPGKVTPFVASSTGNLRWTRDSAFAIFTILDQASTSTDFFSADRHRDQLWSVEAGTTAKVYNLTAISNVDRVNSVRSLTNAAFHPCNHRRLVFNTNLPQAGSAQAIYSVLANGGNTVLLSFSPNKNVALSGTANLLKTREGLTFAARAFNTNPGAAADQFYSRASASLIAPALTILALMVTLLLQ